MCLHPEPGKAGGSWGVYLAGDPRVPGPGGLPAPAWLFLRVWKVGAGLSKGQAGCPVLPLPVQ